MPIPPVADLLSHRTPSLLGLTIAACAFPAVLLADGLAKTLHRR